MWLPTHSVESITRPRLAVAIVSAFAAVSIGYYAYVNRITRDGALPGSGLHRSNAVRRNHRSRRNEAGSSSSSDEAPGDENVDIDTVRPPGDGETVVEGGVDDWWNEPSGFPNQRAGHNIVNLLFRVSEDNARRNGCVHRGCQCNACGMVPIRGVRYRCANCADFDLCETCEAQGVHTKTHIFYKIRVPAPPFGPRQMQPVWYTGDPDTCRRNLPRGLIPKLSKDTGFERPELEAFWEQWTFMANSEWRDDPDELGIAMDRKTFERCLVPTGGSRHAAPNLIHDRMFSFYDSNNDDLIGFTEFLHGLSYRKRKDKLRKIFAGYDIDGDGYVDRRDFLRMFRAYYVLYKQMHKDILDGLEDQLLASTEAQQLVTSRQPLSSLFGREGRVPEGDGGLRHEGKMYNRDGSVQITDGHESVVVQDRGDTANREDILTSLFACETDHRSRRRFITRSDTDTNWRTVRRLSGSDEDRTYWVTLLEPPATVEELPGVLMGNHTLEIEEPSDDNEDEDRDRNGNQPNGVNGVHEDDDRLANGMPTESEVRARVISSNRQRAPKLEKRKRDMARKQLHERWRRRQFYLDEEEGGNAPEDWEHNEDILADLREMGESSKSAEEQPQSPKSPSSSKGRLMDGMSDFEMPSGASSYPRGVPERRGPRRLPEAERDAGKEILYQVTQQAFNELLDTIFKPTEDLALRAAETKQQREKYKDAVDDVELDDSGLKPSNEGLDSKVKSTGDKSLEDLLVEAGYSLDPEGRNAVEIDTTVEIIHEDEPQEDHAEPQEDSADSEADPEADPEANPEDHPEDHRDPTLPQFRPNTAEEIKDAEFEWYPITHQTRTASDVEESEPDSELVTDTEPTTETLKQWKRLTMAEAKATKRGGWGKLSFDEFEAIYKGQEQQGNRLEYLGSWIDFCIP
ncbi:hypothetical protein G7Z17_g6574 [Cylindrodendrum hubeiense]|uniref:Uncharacterized protein n=1 Tax=Cylindrodendrum hubeiense TaxID=595255 RepID=A0A9P5HC33_9HYPO|nr:hypothetical protein G7Z17_g6574 [Cylindrodendrum hubeiense]